jgi:Fungal specific transcription factor domain
MCAMPAPENSSKFCWAFTPIYPGFGSKKIALTKDRLANSVMGNYHRVALARAHMLYVLTEESSVAMKYRVCEFLWNLCLSWRINHVCEINNVLFHRYVAGLKERITWLESIVRSRCPDVDLDQGPDHTATSTSHVETVPSASRITPPGIESGAPKSPLEQRDWDERQRSASPNPQPEGLAHEIGLVSSSAGTDPRYIGPSSGYFFAKLVLTCARRAGQALGPSHRTNVEPNRSQLSMQRKLLQIPPTPLPPSIDYTFQVSKAYFETVHSQYPFLHQPSHIKLIEHVYTADVVDPNAAFQVHMVMAISATVLSRRFKVPLSGEGFCATAMKYFDQLYIENSLKGLQCLLLLLVYALNNPSMGLNVWYLNYQCIAALLDLGLQRDIKAGKNMSLLEQELRTRAFWVIYCLDRTLATITGRPIGLRDEACDFRVRRNTPPVT